MNPQDNQGGSPANPISPLDVIQPGERTIVKIKRHPIGIIGLYFASGIFLIFLAVMAFVVLPKDGSSAGIVGALFFIILSTISLAFVYALTNVYWGNSWTVTSDSLTQVKQTSLFNKQSSELSLANLEDITVDQKGFLASVLNFGTLRAETAAATEKFNFPYCPNPSYYAHQILAAREAFEQKLPDREVEKNRQPLGEAAIQLAQEMDPGQPAVPETPKPFSPVPPAAGLPPTPTQPPQFPQSPYQPPTTMPPNDQSNNPYGQ
jgi:hypothetical protein